MRPEIRRIGVFECCLVRTAAGGGPGPPYDHGRKGHATGEPVAPWCPSAEVTEYRRLLDL